jgi:hypothetical protein
MTVEDQLPELMRERSSAPPLQLDRDLLRALIQARHRTRLALTAAAVVAVALVPAVAVNWLAPAPRSTVTPAASPLGPCVADPQTEPAGLLLAALDPGGGLTTVSADPADADAMLLSVNGKVTTLHGVPHLNRHPEVINASGVVAGVIGYKPIWMVRDGHYSVLPVPSWTVEGDVTGINARGDLVGWVDGKDVGRRALVWPAAAPGTVRELSTPDGWGSSAVAITDSGVIVGYLQDADEQRFRPYRWSVDGTGTTLPDPPADPSPSSGPIPPQVAVLAANGDWVLGTRGVRWNLRTGRADTYTGLAGELIDRQGRIFGEAGDDRDRPAVWVDGQVRMLPVPKATPVGEVQIISPDGTRARGVLWTDNAHRGDSPHYTLWTCGG